MAGSSELLIRLRADVGQAERALGGVANQLTRMGSSRGFQLGALGGGVGITGIMGKAVSASEQFNASFADVQRTVNGLDASGFRQLKTDLLDLSKVPGMPAADDLAQIAAAGGQMNIPSERLMDFTTTVAKMSQITGMSVNDTAEALGKLSNVTGETDLHRLGSEITAVGNVNVGGIPQLVDVSQRLALVGHQLGLGVPEILAIGGAIGDAGIEAEMGGSAVSRIFLEMQKAVSTASSSIVTNTKDVRDAMQKVGDIGDDIGLAEMQRSEMFTKRGRLKKGVSKSSLTAADLRIARLKREQGDAQSDLFDLQHPGQNKLNAFAEMAGMTGEQFGAEFKFSPFNAMQDVLRGLSGMSSDKQQGLLDKAGINNIRDIETLAALSGTAGHMSALFGAGQGQVSNPTALDENFSIKAGTDLAQQQAILHEIQVGLINLGDDLAPKMIAAELSALGMATHLKDSSDVFNGIVGNLDKILPALAGISVLNSIGGLGLLGGLLKAGGGAAGSIGGVAAGAATGVGGTFGGGLAAIMAGTLGAGFMADKVAEMARAQGAPDAVVEALRNFGPPGAAAGAQGVKQIIVDVGGVTTNGGLTWDDVAAQMQAAWNAAMAGTPVTRQLGGAYTP